jgi:hypothetical protein
MHWLPLAGLSVLLLWFLYIERSIWAPASLAGCVWLASTCIGIAVADHRTYWVGVLVIQLLVFSFGIGAIAGQAVGAMTRRKGQTVAINSRIANVSALALLPLAIAAVVVPITIVGMEESGLRAVISLSGALTEMRYHGDNLPIYANSLLSAIYALSILGGWLWHESPSKWLTRMVVVITLTCALTYGLLTTARATFLFSALLFSGGYIAAHCLRIADGRDEGRPAGVILLGTFAAALLFSAFLFGGLIRAGEDDLAYVLHRLDSYLAGVAGLADWLAQSSHWNLGFGVYTFAGVADVLGLNPRAIGITQDYFYLPSGNASNLYTAARWLIEDFGFACGALLLAAFGFLSGYAFAGARKGGRMAAALYGSLISLVLASPVSSLLAYNSIMAALLLFVALIFLCYPSSKATAEASG